MNYRLISDQDVDSVYLGRPCRDFARTVFLNTDMRDYIIPANWHNWNRTETVVTVLYAEYGNTGPGYQPDKRVSWATKLSKDDIDLYSLDKIFKGLIPEQDTSH